MGNKPISVGLFCLTLPHYRLPIFERLAHVADIDLTVYYSREPVHYSLRTVDPKGLFRNRRIALRTFRFWGQDLYLQPELRRVVASGKHDVVILKANPRLLSNFPALWACREHRVGVVWWGLGLMPGQSTVTLTFRRWLMKIPQAVLFYTDNERDFFMSRGLPAEKAFVAQNTIDVSQCIRETSSWSEQRLSVFQVREGLAGRKVLLYCARLSKWKRLGLLLRALETLAKEDTAYLLIVIGDGEGRDEFCHLSKELNLDKSVRWLGPIYKQSKLAPWFLSARALVIPEVLGLTVFHSFAYGLPVITCASYDHQAPESVAVRHEHNGLLYRQGSLADLTACINRVCTDNDLRSLLSDNARHTILTEYTAEKMVNGFCEAIRYAKACGPR